jgi:hypothetical protein
LVTELPKEPGGGAGGMAENAEELPVGPSREAFHRLLSMHGKSSGTAQGAAVLRTMAGNDPPSTYGKSSGTAQGAAVQQAMKENEPPSM